MSMFSWNVYRNRQWIDTVWFIAGMTAEDVKRSLVEHDGYDARIVVSRPAWRTRALPSIEARP